jgi:hypothetical protein
MVGVAISLAIKRQLSNGTFDSLSAEHPASEMMTRASLEYRHPGTRSSTPALHRRTGEEKKRVASCSLPSSLGEYLCQG